MDYKDKNYNINLFDLLYRQKNFLSKEECREIIHGYNVSFEYTIERSSDRYGKNTPSNFSVAVLDPTSEIGMFVRHKLAEAVELYIEHLHSFDSFNNYSLYNYAFRYAHRLRVLRYGIGERIKQHVDHTLGTYGSCTMNLNGDYEGGEFVFLNGRKKIKLEEGELMLFPADFFWVHETLPVANGERFSFNCFLNSIPSSYRDEVFEKLIKTTYVESDGDKNKSVLIPLDRKIKEHKAY